MRGKFKHGDCGSRLHNIWSNMIQRCTNPNNDKYKWYGDRGICVCEEWRDYSTFKEWALSHGYNDSLSIDRINVNGNYTPNNCMWSTMMTQCNNRRNNRVLTYNGESLTVAQWAVKLGIPVKRIYSRLHRGWSVEDTLSMDKKTNQYH